MKKNPLKIAHRGDSGNFPENTVASFTSALNKRVDWIELDVQWVHDTLIVFHDRLLHRVARVEKSIEELSLAELLALDLGNGAKIPKFRDVAPLILGQASLNIELKGFIPPQVVTTAIQELITQGWKPENLLLSSFNHHLLEELMHSLPSIPRAPILYGYPLDELHTVKKLGASRVVIDLHLVSPERVTEFHAQNIEVYVFVVNEPSDIARMHRHGVDGIISNYPERL